MRKVVCWLLITVAAMPTAGAAKNKKMSAADAAVVVVTRFCGAVVGEPPADAERVAQSIAGLSLSAPLTADLVPEPHRSRFRRTLDGAPYALFQIISFDAVDPGSGTLVALLQRGNTMCQVTTLDTPDTAPRLRKQLDRSDSGWQPAPAERDAALYKRRASNGRSVGLMFLSRDRITPINVYLSRPEPGSATPQAIDAFAAEAVDACLRVVVEAQAFSAPSFIGRASDASGGADGGLVIYMRTDIPTGVIGVEKQGGRSRCTIITGDPIDSTAATRDALRRAFDASPGAQDAKATLRFEPFDARVKAVIEPAS